MIIEAEEAEEDELRKKRGRNLEGRKWHIGRRGRKERGKSKPWVVYIHLLLG